MGSVTRTVTCFLNLVHLCILGVVFRVVTTTTLALPIVLNCLSVFHGGVITGKLVVTKSTLALLSTYQDLFSALFRLTHKFNRFALIRMILVVIVLVGVRLVTISVLQVGRVGGSGRLRWVAGQ